MRGHSGEPKQGLCGARPGEQFSRLATNGSRTPIIVQHRSVNRGAACMPFIERRQSGPPTGRPTAASTYGRNGRARRVRG
jgi:hypothetical protein